MRRYQPSSGTEGRMFQAEFCDKCARDGFRITEDPDDSCGILCATMVLDPGDKDYPKEWIANDDGSDPRCTAFIKGDDPAMIEKVEEKILAANERAWKKACQKEAGPSLAT